MDTIKDWLNVIYDIDCFRVVAPYSVASRVEEF